MEHHLSFPQILRRERELRGWSQEVLAEKLGVETRTVRRWERGKTLPNFYARQKLHEVLGKSLQELGLVNDEIVNVSFSPEDDPENEESETPAPQAPESQTSRPIEKIGTIGTVLSTYDAHASWVLAVKWEPNGNRIASAGGDGVVRIWDANTTQTLLTYRDHAWLFQKVNWLPTIYALAWSPDGTRLASAGAGKKVYVWNARNGQTITKYKGHMGVLSHVFAFAWSPDGKYIASACSSGSFDKTIHIWNAKLGGTRFRCNSSYGLIPDFSISSLAWSHEGSHLAAACGDHSIRIWNATTGKLLSTFKSSSDYVYTLAWSPDDRCLALAHVNATAEVFDVSNKETRLTYRGHRESVRDIAWSPDGTCLATASNDTTVQVWNAVNGDCLHIHEEHSAWTTSVAWSPDGTRIASASNDKTVQVWQALRRAVVV